mmetsp:Transcript_14096/g.17113  ORF Transcript_14096/g.17113 Transcript_14096/m.17113 type:complete len:492 (-) Transcript_14096:1751-3226(-)
MELPEKPSDAPEAWKEALNKFVEISKSAKDDFKFSEEYGSDAKEKFCLKLSEAIDSQHQNQTWDDDLLGLALRANCGILRERGEELKPLLEPTHIQKLVAFAKGHTGTGDLVEDYAVKSLNNTFFGLDKTQSAFLELPKEDAFDILFGLLGTASNKALPHLFHVLMHLVAGTNGSKISDQDCKQSATDAINILSKLCTDALKLEEDEEWGRLDFKHGDDVQKSLENGLKYVYAVGATHEGVLPLLKEEDERNKPTDAEIADIVANLSLTDSKVPILDKLGFLLIHLLMSKGEDKKALQEVQHQVFCVLMFAGNVPGFPDFLVQKGVIAKMVDLTVDVLKDIKSFDKSDFKVKQGLLSTLLPMLIVNNTLAENSESAKITMSDKLYPYELPEPEYSEMNEEEAKQAQANRHMEGTTPDEVPGALLKPLMTSYNSNIKRFVGEWIWTLCDGDNAMFILRVGYGNGVHMMAMKAGMMGEILKKQEEDRKKRQGN